MGASTTARALTALLQTVDLQQHNGYTIYTDEELYVRNVLRRIKKKYVYENRQKILRISCGFDIETTKIEEHAFMYHWQFVIDKTVLTGRKWESFEALVDKLNTWCEWQKCIILVWVANLGHEFAFIGRRFSWQNIFAVDSHHPLKARTGRIEFRECLTISGQGGLRNLARNYCKTLKADGDLNYSVIRNSQSELDLTESGYCWTDVEILSEWADYIFETYSEQGKQIPLTAAGIVRSEIRKSAADTGHLEDIKAAIASLYPDRDIYNAVMLYLFRGGYTHANAWWCCVAWDNVIGADFTSSYPAQLLCSDRYYPMSPFVETDLECDGQYITDSRLDSMCCWFIADFFGIERTTYHTIESKHKIYEHEGAVFDNGRLRAAHRITVFLTELDYQIYRKFYTWRGMRIRRSFTAFRGKLPEYYLRPLRYYYEKKCRLKQQGLDNTVEYVNAKAIVNSFYGCTVTRLRFTEWKYNQGEPFTQDGKIIKTGDWYAETSKKTYEKMISNQLLSPFWGIWCTAWGRFRLLECLSRLDDTDPDYGCCMYCDTDSIYMQDSPAVRRIIEEYNREQEKDNLRHMDPIFHDLGCFDWIDADKKTGEPAHFKFKTLGAKRYMKYHDGICNVTVAGLPKGALEKKLARPFATDNSYIAYEDPKHKTGKIGYVDIDEIFKFFSDTMILSCTEAMKTRPVYDPEEYSAEVTDAAGHTEIMTEKSGVAIVDVNFTLTMDTIYTAYLDEIFEKRRMPV